MDILKAINNVFEIEIDGLQKVQASLNNTITSAIYALNSCTGKIVLCGMGKSGHIANKIAATMSSLGIHASFLHPAEALHGDLGYLTSNDVVILISKSGMTSEICALIPNIKLINCKIISITFNADSQIAKAADYSITLPEINEACQLNLAPTSSTTIQLVLGDAMAVVLSELHQFNKNQFALYHPAGSLGKKLITRVCDIMHMGSDNAEVPLGSTLKTAINELSKKGLGAVNIIDDHHCLCGIITDGDIRRYMEKEIDIYRTIVDSIMTISPICTSPDMLAVDALKIMENGEKKLSVLPVVDEEKHLVGLIQLHDIVGNGILL